MINVLYIGDSETVISRYAVCADVFEQSYFNDNGRYLRNPLAGTHGQGRTAIFASDFAPHWADDFVRWPHYATFWSQMLTWLAGDRH